MTAGPAPRVIVAGGSLGGLNAALWLRDVGCEVEVFERSRSPLEGRGAGIVLHPATVRYVTEHRLVELEDIGASARSVRYLAPDGSVAYETPSTYRFTSWNALYRPLLRSLDPDRYHLGAEVAGFDHHRDGVRVHLADGGQTTCDLLVAADGVGSTARSILLPDHQPRYAGYVAWRGIVEEPLLPRKSFAPLHEAITYHLLPHSHILAYPIPNADARGAGGSRRINWVWYRNVPEGPTLDDLMTDRRGVRQTVSLPPGGVRDPHVEALMDTAGGLPGPLRDMVRATAEPFIQVVVDVEVPRMRFDRVCLVGDAAFALRPHAAAGTAKAAEDAWRLARAIAEAGGDVMEGLRRWEPHQLELGRSVLDRSRRAGIRSQFEGTWRVGDPLPFGLYRVGDSAIPDAGEAGAAPSKEKRS